MAQFAFHPAGTLQASHKWQFYVLPRSFVSVSVTTGAINLCHTIHPAIDCAMSPTSRVNVVEPDVGEGPSSGASVAVTKREDAVPASHNSGLPPVLRFPIVAILSFSISSMGYSFINEFTKGELATIVRTLEAPRELGIMTVWRLTELALGWFANFDSVDLAALNFLSHSPVVSNPSSIF